MPNKGRRGQPSQDTIDGVTLPAKSDLLISRGYTHPLTSSYRIKCIVCDRNLLGARFSNKQLSNYRRQIYLKGEFKAERPRCEACTGGPSTELLCVGCNQSKSLELFSKNARSKNRDNAHCWECQQRVSDQEPDVHDAIQEAQIEEDYHKNGISALTSLSSIGSSLPSASRGNSNSGRSETGTEDSGGVWVQQAIPTPRWQTDSRGQTHHNASNESLRRRANSAESEASSVSTILQTSSVGSASGWSAIGQGGASRAGSSSTSQNDKWHKQNAVKKTAQEKVSQTVARSAGGPLNQQLSRDSDEDSEEEFEM